MLNNIEVRKAFLETGVNKWEVAEKLGMTDSSFSRKLRKEMSKLEKDSIINLIYQIHRKEY